MIISREKGKKKENKERPSFKKNLSAVKRRISRLVFTPSIEYKRVVSFPLEREEGEGSKDGEEKEKGEEKECR